jgi:YegS/Rv2252/BmrU family lipid kinase
MKDVMIICNPASRGGRTGRGWPEVAAGLRAAGLDFDVAMTTCAGEATELARAAVTEGRSLVVAAGGDGTVNEVANGFLQAAGPGSAASRLAVLPTGTGGDFRRTFGLPSDVREAAAVLKGGRTRRIDAGRVTCATPDGGTGVRYFVNIASAGIGAEVMARVSRGRRLINGEITIQLASVAALLRWRHKPMVTVIDGVRREDLAQQVVVANCQYFGGGMRVAPRALPDDGLLDVVLVGNVTALENARGMRKFRDGTYLDEDNPKVSFARGRRVEVSSPEVVRVEADGELPGALPATFEVLPGALDLVVP